MKESSLSVPFQAQVTPKPHFLDRLARRAVHHRLSGIEHGVITLVDGDCVEQYGNVKPDCALRASVRVHDSRFYSEIAFGGSIGAGEAFMLGYWTTDDLTALLRILLCNREVLDGLEGGIARLTATLQKALQWAAPNPPPGSRRNIAAHYDLGNDFFRLFLDP